MKSILYTAAGALLILSSCSTAYKSARTPDDVYYSPRTERTYASSNNNQDQDRTAVAAASEDDGTYVTYEDEEQGDYAKRIDRFRNSSSYNGSYYDNGSPNVYVNNYYGGGFGYSPYSYWGGGFGSPYGYGSGLSISLGLGWGWGGGGWYSPWYRPWAYNPWYSPWYSPHYYGGGYWGGGWAGHYYPGGGYYSAPSRGYRSRNGFGGSNYTNANPRVIGNSNTGGRTSGDYRPRRIFRESSGFNGGNNNNNSGGRTYQPRRIFRSSPSETPTVRPGGNNGGNYAPRRTFQSAPQSQPREIRSAPQRSFSAPSYSPPSNSGGSSGGGGGRTFRSRN